MWRYFIHYSRVGPKGIGPGSCGLALESPITTIQDVRIAEEKIAQLLGGAFTDVVVDNFILLKGPDLVRA